jgi:hypothetical protein
MEKKMKNLLKLTAAAVIIAALVFTTACDNGSTGGGSNGGNNGGNGNGNGDNTATLNPKNYNAVLYSISEFREWLPKQPANTAAAPYKVALLASDLIGRSDNDQSVGNVLYTNRTKFVSLDLSYSMGITYIDDNAFEKCTNLTGIILSNKVTGIGEYAFSNCENLVSATIPNSVKSIGRNAFVVCYELTSVTIPEGVTRIFINTFAMCSKLVSITIPNSVTRIGNGSFADCTSLKSVTIGNSVQCFEGRAFGSCTNLTNITIPASVLGFINNPFQGSTNLTSITFKGIINPGPLLWVAVILVISNQVMFTVTCALSFTQQTQPTERRELIPLLHRLALVQCGRKCRE